MLREIKVFYEDPSFPTMQIIPNGNWIDLRAAEEVELKAGDFKLINLGIAMKLPERFEAILAPRSSTFKNFGILQTNSIGVIDTSYCGEKDIWRMPVYATRDTVIHKGDRIAQFRVFRSMNMDPTWAYSIEEAVSFEVVDHLEDENRGGYGSTGIQ